jgi:hypothetical protein
LPKCVTRRFKEGFCQIIAAEWKSYFALEFSKGISLAYFKKLLAQSLKGHKIVPLQHRDKYFPTFLPLRKPSNNFVCAEEPLHTKIFASQKICYRGAFLSLEVKQLCKARNKHRNNKNKSNILYKLSKRKKDTC